mgnify:CR=1 FL=1
MKKLFIVVVMSFLVLSACSKSGEDGVRTGKYGMMSEDTPQYRAVVFLRAVYNDDNIDRVVEMSTKRLGRIIKGFHTNKNVQRQLFSLRLDTMNTEPVSGGSMLFSERQEKANIEMKIIGYYEGDKITDLKTLSLIKVSGDWKVDKVSNTVP